MLAAVVVTALALAGCGGGTSTSSGTPSSSATTANFAPAGDAFLGRWKLHGGPPHFQYQGDLETSAVEFDAGGVGYWTDDYLAGYNPKRVSVRHKFEWRHVDGDKIRITLGSTANDYSPSVDGNELTLTRSDPMAQIITVYDKVTK